MIIQSGFFTKWSFKFFNLRCNEEKPEIKERKNGNVTSTWFKSDLG